MVILLETCCFFGHKTIFNKENLYERLKIEVENLIKVGFSSFLVGTHGEFDKIALSVCKELKVKHNHINICVVLTSLNKLIKKDGFSDVDFYKDRNIETLYYPIENIHFKQKIIFSNHCMIDDSDIVVCYVNMSKQQSGAKQAIKYAQKKNKEIINLFV